MAQRSKRELKVRAFAVKDQGEADVTGAFRALSPYNSQRFGRQLESIDRQLETLQEFARAADDTIDAAALSRAFHRYQTGTQRVCLFNIIVALEWTPSVEYLEDLKAAFAEASKLLADAADGYMAIGQVTVGGRELMACADIQIFASNRLFPRSSVDGLNNPEKYQPIRLGRGLRSKNQRETLPWSSKKGVATLVHEWGHYALGLKDQYLKLEESELVLPQNRLASDTLMARLDRSDLLDDNDVRALVNERKLRLLSPRDGASDDDPASEWEALRQHPRYDWLGIDPDHKKQLAPPNEDVIPAFHIIGTADDPYAARELQFSLNGAGKQKIDPVHCWAFVLKGTDEDLTARGFIPQGELEEGGKLRLLGAQVGDEVVLIGHAPNKEDRPVVLRAKIADDRGGSAVIGAWDDDAVATPESYPILDVVARGASPAPPYTIDLPGLNREQWDATVFPYGRQRRAANAAVTDLDVLDGHVMVVSKGEGEQRLAIASYALGGSPFSGYPGHPNPIPAGSADGNAMILFYDTGDDPLSYANIYPSDGTTPKGGAGFDASKVVVTTNLEDDMPHPDNWLPRSYTFSVTSNTPFGKLAGLHPTLVLFFDKETLENLEDRLVIGRYDAATKSWADLETTAKLEDFFAATSLQVEKAAPGLFADPPRPDQYRLFLVKQDASQ